MKIAFTSRTGEIIDEHFGQSTAFVVWDVSPGKAEFVETLTLRRGIDGDEEDRISARADLLEGCAIVYTMAIGGPAAAKLVARRIHPMKTNAEVPVKEIVAKLQEVLQGDPPPWLRKAMLAKDGATGFA